MPASLEAQSFAGQRSVTVRCGGTGLVGDGAGQAEPGEQVVVEEVTSTAFAAAGGYGGAASVTDGYDGAMYLAAVLGLAGAVIAVGMATRRAGDRLQYAADDPYICR
jgi:hypothetical protein